METAHKTKKEKKELFDTPEVLDQKVDTLVELIRKSKHFVVFTGAGVSTSAGVPDFRSGVNTVLPTGPGAWEEEASGKRKRKSYFRKPIESAIPTPCHMALVKLEEVGYLKFLISQNTDGLHRKSGFPVSKLAELHGNQNLEVCKNQECLKEYLRDYDTCVGEDDHLTGSCCENCGEKLYDTVIHFEEKLPEKDLDNGFLHSGIADLCVVFGSSLRVTPTADMPLETAKSGGQLVIVNLQPTPLDNKALRINGFIDDVINRMMSKLGLTIPKFILKRRLLIMKREDPKQEGKVELFLRGVDEKGGPYSCFTGINISFPESKERISRRSVDPYRVIPKKQSLEKGRMKAQFKFQGHNGEPDLDLEISLEDLKLNEPIYFLMEFDPEIRKWISCTQVPDLM